MTNKFEVIFNNKDQSEYDVDCIYSSNREDATWSKFTLMNNRENFRSIEGNYLNIYFR
jgi:hypothetical protein